MNILDEFRLLKKESQKFSDGERNLFDHLINRRIATFYLFFIRNYTFSPNWITSASVVWALIASIALFYSQSISQNLIVILLLNISLTFDTLDGQYARYKNLGSEFGGWYDGVSDCFKYIFILLAMGLTAFYHSNIEEELWIILLSKLGASQTIVSLINDHPIISMILAFSALGHIFMIYYIHTTRYKLSFNQGAAVQISSKKIVKKKYHLGIETLIYAVFTVLIPTGQKYGLLVFLNFFLPVLWIYPFYLTFKNSKRNVIHE